MIFYMWPDRLTNPRWLKRCRFEGDRKLLELGEDERAIVLASVHYGPFEILPYWLRAYGIPATSVRADPPAALQSLTNYQYSLTPPADIPVFIFASQLTPMPKFSHIRKILGPGAMPIRATLFDKSPASNWLVVWHQDTALPMRERRETAGWGPWSVKEGVNLRSSAGIGVGEGSCAARAS